MTWYDFLCGFSLSFQLTSSQGGWLYLANKCHHTEYFSTHILTRRMTPFIHFPRKYKAFQLTSSQGGWLSPVQSPHRIPDFSTHILTRRMTMKPYEAFESKVFQLTSSQGGWPSTILFNISLLFFFNSHPHKEDDIIFYPIINKYHIFNSHPHKEDDSESLKTDYITFFFQLTSSQGGWQNREQRKGRT